MFYNSFFFLYTNKNFLNISEIQVKINKLRKIILFFVFYIIIIVKQNFSLLIIFLPLAEVFIS